MGKQCRNCYFYEPLEGVCCVDLISGKKPKADSDFCDYHILASEYGIVDLIGLDEVLCQLAKEAAELSKAALKYRRNLIEEFADVRLCFSEVARHSCKTFHEATKIAQRKRNRWLKRINEAQKAEGTNGKETGKE